MRTRKRLLLQTVVMLAVIVALTLFGKSDQPISVHTADSPSWITVWKGEPPLAFHEESQVVRSYPDTGVTVARPKPGIDEKSWVARWQSDERTVSVEPNQSYRMAKVPNDPMLSHQKYLQQIHAPEAWDITTGSPEVVIAVVDTGIQLAHPDLAPLLVKGTNLVQPGTPPEDDNGHGTNVTGVIAAAAGNDKGVAGILWDARIMPIKALEADGTGDEDRLGEGIRYAVTHGAKIVVLSLGLNKPSTYMETIIAYAESKGVLLVAASGNEGKAVKYPAAYPTVLAVGGVMADNTRATLSNYGDELDLVAPWNVFTTARGDNYAFSGGTSLAAPQAAAVAGLMLGINPQLSPHELRSLLRESAETLSPGAGWNNDTGYGLLRADRAVAAAATGKVPTGRPLRNVAQPLPIGKQTDVTWNNDEAHWFKLTTRYPGFIDLDTRPLAVLKEAAVELYAADSDAGMRYEIAKTDNLSFPVGAGTYWLKLTAAAAKTDVVYHLTPRFRMAKDLYEDNDRPYSAFTLAAKTQSLTANLHRYDDVDWYAIRVDRPARLRVEAAPDTPRIDLTLMVRREEDTGTPIDLKNEGEPEAVEVPDAKPGLYYIRVGSVERSEYPPDGEYTLKVTYEPDTQTSDPYEPNNKAYQATDLTPDTPLAGVLADAKDQDWFRFKLSKRAEVRLSLSRDANASSIPLVLMDSELKRLAMSMPSVNNDANLTGNERAGQIHLDAGDYYIQLMQPEEASGGGAYRLQLQILQ